MWCVFSSVSAKAAGGQGQHQGKRKQQRHQPAGTDSGLIHIAASLPGGGHIGDGPPDAVALMVDAQDADRHTSSPGRTAAGRMGTQAVDAAIQGDKDAVEIH